MDELQRRLGEDGVERAFVVGNQDNRRVGSMFCLAQEVGSCDGRIRGRVDDDECFARPGWEVDTAHAIYRQLRCGDPGPSGTNDEVDGFDRLGSVGKGADRLCATGGIDLVDSEKRTRRQDEGVDGAMVSAGTHHGDLLHTGHLGGYNPHEHRRRVGSASARHVYAGAGDRGPSAFDDDTRHNLDAVIHRSLTFVNDPDVLGGCLQCLAGDGPNSAESRSNRLGWNTYRTDRRTASVFSVRGKQSGVATEAYSIDDLCGRHPDGWIRHGRTACQRPVVSLIEFGECDAAHAHAIICSTGSTRMPDAPAARSLGRICHRRSASTTECTATMPL